MSQIVKSATVAIFDLLIVLVSLILSYALRYGDWASWFTVRNNFIIYLIYCGCALLPNVLLGTYTSFFQFAGLSDALRQGASSFISFAVTASLPFIAPAMPAPEIAAVCAMSELILMCCIRFFKRALCLFPLYRYVTQSRKKRHSAVIFSSAGDVKPIMDKLSAESGAVASVVLTSPVPGYFRINGVKVSGGGFGALEKAMRKCKPEELVITKKDFPELPRLIRLCSSQGCRLRIYSGIEELKKRSVRDINIEDLLGRTQARLDLSQISGFIRGKTVLVTGGAGSIGSEICRQTMKSGCSRLIVFDFCENSLFALDHELLRSFGSGRHIITVGSVCDRACLERVFSRYRPQVVFHAAAHKHVPLMELNPEEAVRNNVAGTRSTALAAIKHGVQNFVLISTDKAVDPANIMGATKRVAELMIQSLTEKASGTVFAAVRFGNVLGSNGSVIPLFQKQISAGGPVTVTHPDMERYFMTISEAAQLVMQAGSMAKGGEIFVLDMGEPVKIVDLASAMIRFTGMEPDRDIKIEFTGLRPGEKLTEKLVRKDETLAETPSGKILMCSPAKSDPEFWVKFSRLQSDLAAPENDCRKVLMDFLRGCDA